MSEMICGNNVVKEAIKQKVKILNLYISSNNKEMLSLATEKNLKYKIVEKNFLDKLISNHQGVVAEIEGFKTYELKDIVRNSKDSLIVMLEGLEDPHNLGAILRTADAAGVDGVIIPKHRSVRLNSTVAKVSTGAIFTVKCVEVTNLANAIDKLKSLGYWIVGAETSPNSVDYRSIKYDMPTVLVIGSEGKGISRLVTSKCDFLVKIPMAGSVTSLNASVSAGILMYEIKKDQR